jgi:hypothetical protein
MNKLKLIIYFLVVISVAASNVAVFYGCSYILENIGWGKFIFGIIFQVVGICALYVSLLLKNDDLIPGDYFRVGFFRSKWFYSLILTYLGAVLFAAGLNHPSLDRAFNIGESWWTCPAVLTGAGPGPAIGHLRGRVSGPASKRTSVNF